MSKNRARKNGAQLSIFLPKRGRRQRSLLGPLSRVRPHICSGISTPLALALGLALALAVAVPVALA